MKRRHENGQMLFVGLTVAVHVVTRGELSGSGRSRKDGHPGVNAQGIGSVSRYGLRAETILVGVRRGGGGGVGVVVVGVVGVVVVVGVGDGVGVGFDISVGFGYGFGPSVRGHEL